MVVCGRLLSLNFIEGSYFSQGLKRTLPGCFALAAGQQFACPFGLIIDLPVIDGLLQSIVVGASTETASKRGRVLVEHFFSSGPSVPWPKFR